VRTADRETTSTLASPERLREFFAPRSIAVVGASDTSGWARFVAASAVATGFDGPLIPVHPKHQTVFGRPAVRSLRDLPEPVDLAFILAPADAVESVLDDAGAAGVRGAIVLASGYREVGDEGRAAERRLITRAAEHGITLLGPNCLGFLNAHARAGPFALTVPPPLLAGPVGIALQSGALASVVLGFARSRAIGVSTLTTMGNEAMIAATDMIEYLVQDDSTRAICLFLEEIRDPARFARAAGRASEAGKPIVAMKVGSSQAGRQAALAHTGSVAGDDAVVDAVLRQLNVIRVTSIEDLLCTAALLGYDRWPRGRRMGVLTASGGACDIIADRASSQGIEMPQFAPRTAAGIAVHMPPFATVRNPLDVTGYFLANQRTSALTAIDHALDQAVADPGLDFVLFAGVTLPDARPADEALAGMIDERIAWLGQRIASAPIPVIPIGSTCVDVTPYGRDLLGRHGIHLLGGIELGVRALGSALRWLEFRGRDASLSQGRGPTRPPQPSDRDDLSLTGGQNPSLGDGYGQPSHPATGSYPVPATQPQPHPATTGHPEPGTQPQPHPATTGHPEPATQPHPGTANHPEPGTQPHPATATAPEPGNGPWSEAAARDLVAGHGVPVVPGELVNSADEAVTAARCLGMPVALKICSAQITHKSDIGGVALGLASDAEVRAGYERVRAAADAVAGASIEGILVTPMRQGGVELLAGVSVDPAFGPVLAVGLGGIWVELLNDTSLRVLPVDAADVKRMLGELRGLPLLTGARGTQPADIDALARVVTLLCDAAASVGGALRELEVNPLWVSGDQIEALDVLVVTGHEGTAGPRSAETPEGRKAPESTTAPESTARADSTARTESAR